MTGAGTKKAPSLGGTPTHQTTISKPVRGGRFCQSRFDRRRELIAEAKRRVPIPDAWQRLGLPGNPEDGFNPFREDRHAGSFSIFADGRAWKDFATGDSGDVITFIQRALNCTRGEAIRKLFELAGIEDAPAPNRKRRRRWPEFRKGTRAEKRALAGLRNLGPEAIELAADAGFLWFANMRDAGETVVAWVVTDSTRRNAQARRLDGKPWQSGQAKGAKAKTLPGAQAAWPIGAADIGDRPLVALVEGGGDFVAAFHFLYNEGREDVAPVAMLGAGMRIPGDALPHFKGRRIRIFPHTDPQGQAAGEKWAMQLHRAGAGPIDFFGFHGLTQTGGEPVCDLNDLTNQDCDNWETHFDARTVLPWNE